MQKNLCNLYLNTGSWWVLLFREERQVVGCYAYVRSAIDAQGFINAGNEEKTANIFSF
jgi:hypothetical protein